MLVVAPPLNVDAPTRQMRLSWLAEVDATFPKKPNLFSYESTFCSRGKVTTAKHMLFAESVQP